MKDNDGYPTQEEDDAYYNSIFENSPDIPSMRCICGEDNRRLLKTCGCGMVLCLDHIEEHHCYFR